jgi:hypothetical protein
MKPNPRIQSICRRAAAAVLMGLATAAAPTWSSDTGTSGGELRLQAQGRRVNDQGPLAQARSLQPGMAPTSSGLQDAELEWRHLWRGRPGGRGIALATNVLGWVHHDENARDEGLRVNELHLALDAGAWQFSAGKKVLGWDVGYGFRPNDVVQQEARRTLLASTPEGRPLLQAEYFGAEHAHTLVWVQPHHARRSAGTSRGADESALAWRGYWRHGALDLYGFGRWGRHTGASAGVAMAWVATDAWEIHASVRALRRHDGWSQRASDSTTDPWQRATLGSAVQSLVGAQWTGTEQHSVLVEYWHDGTTLSDDRWHDWNLRSAALTHPTATGLQVPARAGLLAWQTTPMTASSLRRDNLFVRLAWQPQAWQASLDVLWHPADRGRLITTALQWQGDAWRLNAAWRLAGGPSQSLLAQTPVRHTLLVAATRSF